MQPLNWYEFIQHTIVSHNLLCEKLPNVIAVAVFAAKTRVFEISSGALPPPPSPVLDKVNHHFGFLFFVTMATAAK